MAAESRICNVGATRAVSVSSNGHSLGSATARSISGSWKSSKLALAFKEERGPGIWPKKNCKHWSIVRSSQISFEVPVSADGSKGDGKGYQLNFVERLVKAWAVLFPSRTTEPSNAEIAKERLRLVLYSDRGEVSPEIRRKLRENIIEAISTYVEIETEEEVRLSVSADPDVGTVYSVTVPVRRVKPEYQSHWGDGDFRDRVYFGEEGQTIYGSAELRFDSGAFDAEEDSDSFEE